MSEYKPFNLLFKAEDREQVNGADVAARIARGLISEWNQENVILLCLNTRSRLISARLLFLGSLDTCIMHPREIFKAAILDSASHIIVVHNHPSMDLSPSDKDRETTKNIFDSGKMLGIKLVDAIIINNNGEQYSFIGEL